MIGIRFFVLPLVFAVAIAAVATTGPNSPENLMKSGNYKEAYDQLAVRLNAPDAKPIELQQAIACLNQLNRPNETDTVLEAVIAQHGGRAEMLLQAATDYLGLVQHGALVAGKFVRGNPDGAGNVVNSHRRDEVRSVQLLLKALSIANSELRPRVLEKLSNALDKRGGLAWQLQRKTDFTTLPDYDEGWGYGGDSTAAPVDAENRPVFYATPASWDAAQNDGERWRWVLAELGKTRKKFESQRIWADFCRSQFGVETLREYGIQLREDGPTDNTGSILALSSLKDEETTARLATGVQRFSLPDEHNPLKIYQTVAAAYAAGNDPLNAQMAAATVADMLRNRRQFPRAAEWLQKAIDYHATSAIAESYRQQRNQIVRPWGQFGSVQTQTPERGAQFEFRFRNATEVEFSAQPIDTAKLLADLREYLESNPKQLDWQKLDIENIGYQFVQGNQQKYLGAETARWTTPLKSPADHFDALETITSPLQKPGAYLITAKLKEGNTANVIVWVADTAIVRKPLADKMLYYVADAASGEPVAGATLDLLGYQQIHDDARPNRFRLDTRRFAANTSADGLAEVAVDEANFAPEKQWLVTATTPEGRFAFLGFSYVWRPQWSQPIFDQPRTIVITDRPVYRPGDKVKWKAWVGQAQYDAEGSPFAQVAFQAELHDAKGEKRESYNLTSNAFGGIEGEYKLPTEAALGSYSLQILGHGAGNFRVEEYKKPEYEVTVEAPSDPVKLGDKFKATVAAKYYFGSPVTKATVKYKVTRQARTNRWFPPRPWDWLYGEGYGWMGGNYSWHPGWHRWGCLPPPPWWWPQNVQPPEIVAQGEALLDAEGKLAIEIDTALAKELHGNEDHAYTIEAQVVDASRRTIVGAGSVTAARKPFDVYVWLNRGYVRTGDTITAHVAARRPDGKPITGAGVLTLKKITFEDANSGEPTETEIQHWDLVTGDNGEAELAFKASAEGQYRLCYTLTDTAGEKIEGAAIIKILGPEFAGGANPSGLWRFEELEVTLDKPEYRVGDTAKLLVSRNRPGGAVLLFVRPSEGVYPAPQVLRPQAKSTVVEIPITTADQPNFFVEAVSISGGKVHVVAKQVVVPPKSRVLKVDVLPSATAYKPGAEATVKLRVTDEAGEAVKGDTVVAIYDRSVEYISGGSNVADIRTAFWDWKRTHNPNTEHSLGRVGYNLTPKDQEAMQSLGTFGDELQLVMSTRALNRGGFGGGGRREMMMDRMSVSGAMAPAAPMMAMEKSAEAGAGGESAPLVQPTVRENFADTALWVGSLETGPDGVGEVKLTLPDSLTTWKIRVWSLGGGARVGEGTAEVIARKNLLIRLQTPRFLMETDEVILSGIVHNYLPEAKRVTVKLELEPRPSGSGATQFLTPLSDLEQTLEIPAGGEQRVDWRVKATAEGTATVRALALTDEESDAMKLKLPVVVHGIQKLEARSGVIASAANSGRMEFIVPEKRRPEQTTLTVQFSPTLAGAMIDALPYLLDYPHGCTEQTLNRFVPAVITQNTLRRMGVNLDDIAKKRTNLNAQELGDPDERAKQWKRFDTNPVFDEAEMQKIVTTGVRRLSDMQLTDGGWGWFSGFGEQSSAHTTATVVRGLQVAQKNGAALLPETLPRGLAWLKNYQSEELAALANWRDGKTIDKDRRAKQFADNLDALVYLTLAEAGEFNASMRERLYTDRTHLSPYSLAMFGIALQTQISAAPADALTAQRDMVIRNLSQFVVRDPENQTAYLNLPRNAWWFWYGSEFEAHAYYLKLLAATDPKGDLASQLVKYLLNNRKNSTYWNSTRDTALVIEALADYMQASGEESPELTVEVWLDGAKRQTVAINKENLFTFNNRFALTGEEVKSGRHEFELRKTGAGRLYYNGYLEVFTKEDDIRAAGLEVKVARKLYKLTQSDAKAAVSGARGQALEQAVEKYDRTEITNLATIQSGDLVQVELLITSKNDYEYLLITDPKPAGCEAVDLNSGYNGNALGAYMEFRDRSVNLFVRTLPRGERSVTYSLRAETPGQFSALPTQIAAMYAPELRGNSDEVKIKIEDR